MAEPRTCSDRLPIHKMIEIVTSSWFAKLPPHHVRIGISRGIPQGATGYKMFRALQPGPWFKSAAPAEYTKRYFDEVLGRLDPASVVDDLAAITQGDVAVLVCWEPPPPSTKWCH